MALSIGAVVLRVRDLDREVAFWSAALDYVPRSAEGNRFDVCDLPADAVSSRGAG